MGQDTPDSDSINILRFRVDERCLSIVKSRSTLLPNLYGLLVNAESQISVRNSGHDFMNVLSNVRRNAEWRIFVQNSGHDYMNVLSDV